MISVKELAKESRLPGNYFAPESYILGDLESGLIENRDGGRLLALPESFIQSIYEGLTEEVGIASEAVLYKCGAWWGKTFYRRFAEEVRENLGRPLAEIDMIEFLQSLQQCWKTHGWGLVNFDFSKYQHGFLVVTVTNSAFARSQPSLDKPKCFVEAGLLSSFFSGLTGQKLTCTQTTCESMGADCNSFILGLPERMRSVPGWVEEQLEHDAILAQLCTAEH